MSAGVLLLIVVGLMVMLLVGSMMCRVLVVVVASMFDILLGQMVRASDVLEDECADDLLSMSVLLYMSSMLLLVVLQMSIWVLSVMLSGTLVCLFVWMDMVISFLGILMLFLFEVTDRCASGVFPVIGDASWSFMTLFMEAKVFLGVRLVS